MKHRGFALIAALLMCVILLVLGVGLLSKVSFQYAAHRMIPQLALARSLAQSGLADALLKLDRDGAFPPFTSQDQKVFSYSESVTDSRGLTRGGYQVEIDRTLADLPWKVLLVRSRGQAGNSLCVLRGELDIATKLRSNTALPNPNAMRWIQICEGP
ncbi:hypothetical protein IV102_37095 [bacterium]|nr:hypothetical protein [bacterium]